MQSSPWHSWAQLTPHRAEIHVFKPLVRSAHAPTDQNSLLQAPCRGHASCPPERASRADTVLISPGPFGVRPVVLPQLCLRTLRHQLVGLREMQIGAARPRADAVALPLLSPRVPRQLAQQWLPLHCAPLPRGLSIPAAFPGPSLCAAGSRSVQCSCERSLDAFDP